MNGVDWKQEVNEVFRVEELVEKAIDR